MRTRPTQFHARQWRAFAVPFRRNRKQAVVVLLPASLKRDDPARRFLLAGATEWVSTQALNETLARHGLRLDAHGYVTPKQVAP